MKLLGYLALSGVVLFAVFIIVDVLVWACRNAWRAIR